MDAYRLRVTSRNMPTPTRQQTAVAPAPREAAAIQSASCQWYSVRSGVAGSWILMTLPVISTRTCQAAVAVVAMNESGTKARIAQ